MVISRSLRLSLLSGRIKHRGQENPLAMQVPVLVTVTYNTSRTHWNRVSEAFDHIQTEKQETRLWDTHLFPIQTEAL